MGHLLSSVNPQAAVEADSGWKPAGPPLSDQPAMAPEVDQTPKSSFLPAVGASVRYHFRDGDSRNMRTAFPALVLDVNQAEGTISLLITVDAGDFWRQDHVQPWAAPEPGWEWIEDNSPLTILLGARIIDLERTVMQLTRRNGLIGEPVGQSSDGQINPALKRGPGRPPKPKAE